MENVFHAVIGVVCLLGVMLLFTYQYGWQTGLGAVLIMLYIRQGQIMA